MGHKLRLSRRASCHVLLAPFFIFVPFFFLCQPNVWSSDPAQEKIRQPTTLQYEVSVTLKLIQVFVTDKQGKPVKDLNKSDFEIFDNGQRKTITDFEKHFLALAEKKPDQKEMAELQKTAVPPAAQLPKLNRKLFFIFDIQQNDGLGFLQSKKAALHFMDTQVQPTDEIGILSYQVRIGLKMHEYLNTDHKKIRKAIEKLKGIPGTGNEGAVTGSVGEEDISGILTGLGWSPPSPEADEATMMRLNYVAIMTELAKTLRYIPGHKNIIFFSTGYARSTLARDIMFQKNFEDMCKQFGSSSCPIYTVNTMGSRSRFMSPDDRGDQSLQNLAAFSGGQYFEDVAKVEKIETGIQNAIGNYYVLGYSIDEKWDGQFHEIKVKVKREGCNVSAQSGYYNPKPFTEFSEFEKQLHLMDLAFNEHPQFQSPLELPFIALPCRDESGTHLVFMTDLPWEGLKEIIRQQTEVVYVVIDQDDNVIESKRGDVQIPDISKKQVVYYGIISPKPGAYDCVMILRNLVTGKAARARGAATVSQPFLSGLQLDSPLLLVPTADKDVAYFKLIGKDNKDNKDKEAVDTSAIGLKDFFPFLSNRLVPVMDEIQRETSKVLAIVRSAGFNVPNADIEFSASLKPSPGGEEVPLSLSILNGKRQGKTDILLLEFPFPELKPGEYTLTIVAMDKNSEAKTEVSRTIRVI